MKLGSSEDWPVSMKILTSQEKVKSDAFLEYFKPLADWLEKENGNFPN